jgi:hypothetical protein
MASSFLHSDPAGPFTVPAARMYGQLVALVIAARHSYRRRGMGLLSPSSRVVMVTGRAVR